MTEQRLNELSDLQFNILRNGVSLLKKNGSIVYSTCSLSEKQNEEIVRKVMKLFLNQGVVLEIVDLWHQLAENRSRYCDLGLIKSELIGAVKIDAGVGFAGAIFICKLKKIDTNNLII